MIIFYLNIYKTVIPHLKKIIKKNKDFVERPEPLPLIPYMPIYLVAKNILIIINIIFNIVYIHCFLVNGTSDHCATSIKIAFRNHL